MLMSACVVQPCPDSVYFELTRNLVIIAGVTIGIAVVVVSICPSLNRCTSSLFMPAFTISPVLTTYFCFKLWFIYKTLTNTREGSQRVMQFMWNLWDRPIIRLISVPFGHRPHFI